MKPWRSNVVRFGTGAVGFLTLFGVSIDQCANGALRRGDPDMTISADCGYALRWEDDGGESASAFCHVVCDALEYVDKNHCREATE
jgi:hypothetical protein